MNDIVKDAKRLLEGATLGPWEWIGYDLEQTFDAGGAIVMEATCENPHLGGVVNVEITPEDERLIAAAPELAQALAEETWEYGVEYKYLTNRGAEWRLDPGVGWHKTYRDAERAASASVRYRIVRRRVSPPEVINE